MIDSILGLLKMWRFKFLFILAILAFLNGCADNESKMTDIDGNDYSVKNYQGVLWMTENLKVTRDRDGKAIQYYNPNQDPMMKREYGLLYDYETACKICPKGWELPDNNDWVKLITGDEGSVKSQIFKDPPHWVSEEIMLNVNEFSVSFAGYGNNGEHPNNFKKSSILWSKSSTEEFAWSVVFEKNNNKVRQAEQHLIYGFSVRCVKK